MTTTVTRCFEFDYGHRVLGHAGKCRHLHGHRAKVEITVQTESLNELGMVVDFSCIKEKVGQWIDDHLDHNLLLNDKDPLRVTLLQDPTTHEKLPYLMIGNPTAENIATLLYEVANNLLSEDGVRVVWVRVYETPNCWADYAG